jgi:methanogenic corrinoid protein MtbC1
VEGRSAPHRKSGPDGQLSIGALSAAIGVPVDTIRSWERRYGFPVAERTPSGHRVYSLATIPRLRRIAEAMRRGHRAAQVLGASDAALDALLATVPPLPDPRSPLSPADPGDLLPLISEFNVEGLKRALQSDWVRLGPLQFLDQRAAPLLEEVGAAWAAGRLDVRHEHFASSVLGDFLRAVRMPLDDRARGPVAALTTLPGELHGLGLQMCALVFALAGWRALILGVDTPIGQVGALAREAPVSVVAVSCVRHPRKGALEALRDSLPRRVPLLVGGSGAPPSGRGVKSLPDLAALDRWLQTRGAA